VSNCDGTTHVQSAQTLQPDGTRPSRAPRIAIRLPPLRFLSFSEPFTRQPRRAAVVRAAGRRAPALGSGCRRPRLPGWRACEVRSGTRRQGCMNPEGIRGDPPTSAAEAADARLGKAPANRQVLAQDRMAASWLGTCWPGASRMVMGSPGLARSFGKRSSPAVRRLMTPIAPASGDRALGGERQGEGLEVAGDDAVRLERRHLVTSSRTLSCPRRPPHRALSSAVQVDRIRLLPHRARGQPGLTTASHRARRRRAPADRPARIGGVEWLSPSPISPTPRNVPIRCPRPTPSRWCACCGPRRARTTSTRC
jgi:hypothetical protein